MADLAGIPNWVSIPTYDGDPSQAAFVVNYVVTVDSTLKVREIEKLSSAIDNFGIEMGRVADIFQDKASSKKIKARTKKKLSRMKKGLRDLGNVLGDPKIESAMWTAARTVQGKMIARASQIKKAGMRSKMQGWLGSDSQIDQEVYAEGTDIVARWAGVTNRNVLDSIAPLKSAYHGKYPSKFGGTVNGFWEFYDAGARRRGGSDSSVSGKTKKQYGHEVIIDDVGQMFDPVNFTSAPDGAPYASDVAIFEKNIKSALREVADKQMKSIAKEIK